MFVKIETKYSCGHIQMNDFSEYGNFKIEKDYLNLFNKKQVDEICVDCFFENIFNKVIQNN